MVKIELLFRTAKPVERKGIYKRSSQLEVAPVPKNEPEEWWRIKFFFAMIMLSGMNRVYGITVDRFDGVCEYLSQNFGKRKKSEMIYYQKLTGK